jgi:glycosyltransferase involved in cell wall biosynthesis
MLAAVNARPVTVVVPTYNSTATLELALGSLRVQRYDAPIEILCVDGGSSDASVEIAKRYGAAILDNPRRIQEEGIALGIEAAESELVLVLDADDELPHDGWLAKLAWALELAPDVVAADCLFHTWRRQDPAINRLAALIGGTDPIAIELGWADRWSYHLQRWTGMPVREQDAGGALLVQIDPERAPPMGSNGFLVRREELLRVRYRPFIHPQVVAQLAARGWRFARVRESVIHHFVPNTRAVVRKVRQRTRRTMTEYETRGRPPGLTRLRIATMTIWSLTLIGPSFNAVRGFLRRPDPAWALYPFLHALWTTCYGIEAVRAAAHRLRRR